jgi:hypothetical protein
MAPPPLPPGLADIADGAKSLIYDLPGHHDWDGISCPTHGGRQMVRQGTKDVPPANVGFQRTCDACVATVKATLEYMLARYADVARSQP